MPWRISYFVSPNGIKITESKNMFAQFLRFAHIHNRLVCESHEMLKALHDRSDNPVTTFSVCLCTWAKVGEEDILKERASKMVKVVQSWGLRGKAGCWRHNGFGFIKYNSFNQKAIFFC